MSNKDLFLFLLMIIGAVLVCLGASLHEHTALALAIGIIGIVLMRTGFLKIMKSREPE